MTSPAGTSAATPKLSDVDEARGRARAYALLAHLVARGPSEATLTATRASEHLAEGLDAYASLDEAAADHQHVFGMSVPPFEGVFLDPEGVVGGVLADRLHDTYRAIGFAPDPTTEEAEHLSTELRALAHLASAESDALEDGRRDLAEHLRLLSVRMLDGHLLRWLPTLTAAVRDTERAWPCALVDQIEDLVLMHREALGAPMLDLEPFTLAPLPPLLDADDTGLADVARVFTLPALSGTFLSRDDIARIGRGHRIPRGFGERRVLLENLFRSAAALDAFGDVIADLGALLRDREAALAAPRLAALPHLAALGTRIAETAALLTRLQTEARTRAR